jgi:flavin-binding protein dodecin
MTYRISYVDSSSSSTRAQRPTETVRTEDYTSEQGALARARALLDRVDCHRVLVSDGVGEPICGVRLQLKVGFTTE